MKLEVVKGKAEVDSKAIITEINQKLSEKGLPAVLPWKYDIEFCPIGIKFKGVDMELVENIKSFGITKDQVKGLMSAIELSISKRDEEAGTKLSQLQQAADLAFEKGYTFSDPHKFFCEIASEICGAKITKVFIQEATSKMFMFTVEETAKATSKTSEKTA